MTDSEQWLIKSLVERSPLPNSVINVLVHYVLVVQTMPLCQEIMNNIAAQWSELKIGMAEDAIKHVRSLVRSAKENAADHKPAAKIIREEKLPSWAEKPVEETALTPERQAELDKNCKTTCIRKLVTSNGRCRENLGKLLDKRNYRDQFSAMMAEVLQDPDVKAFIAENEEVLTEADIQKLCETI